MTVETEQARRLADTLADNGWLFVQQVGGNVFFTGLNGNRYRATVQLLAKKEAEDHVS